MPFPMVHLNIARNVLSAASGILEPSQFLLGSIAPDSVHFRPDYQGVMKKASHLCVGNEEWAENVLRFAELNRRSPNTDFVLGYCAHVLADIKHNIEMWTPYRLAHQEQLDRGLGSDLHKEAAEVDLELYLTCQDRPELWALLSRSESIDIPGMVRSADIDMAKSHLLWSQYADRKQVDLSSNKFVTVKRMTGFVAEASQEIRNRLLSGR